MVFLRRAWFAAGLCAALAVTSCALVQTRQDPASARKSAEASNREGLNKLQSGGDAAAAEAKFRDAVAADPTYADARVNLGVLLREQGRAKEALAELQKAVALAPDNAAAHNNLGVAYDQQRSPGLAVNEFKRALELDPRLRGAKLNLAVAYGHLGRSDLAATTFLEILREDPENIEGYAGLGAVYARGGRFESAVGVYRDGLAKAPADPRLLGGLGVVWEAAGDPTAAVDAYDKALKTSPNATDLLAARGALALKLGDYSAAVVYFSKMSNLEWARRNRRQSYDKEGLADAFFTLGDIETNLGQYTLAAKDYARAVTLDPLLRKRAKSVDPDAHFALGVIYQEAGYLPQAKSEYELTLKLRPDSWAAWRNLGETYYELGNLGKSKERKANYDKAAENFTKALQLKRDDARTHYDLGLLYYRQANIEESYLKKGKYRLAALELQNALPDLDANPELHLSLGVIFDQLGQYADAASSYARAATLAPDNSVIYYLGGIAHRNDKRYEKAIALLEKAVRLDPGNQDPLYALGIVYQDINDDAQAEAYFKLASQAGGRGYARPVTSIAR